MKKAGLACGLVLAAVGLYCVLGEREPLSGGSPAAPAGGEATALPDPAAEPGAASTLQAPAAASGSAPSRDPASGGLAAAPLAGTVSHAETGDGVPHYTFTLLAGDTSEELTTDEQGAFASQRAFPLELVAQLSYDDVPAPSSLEPILDSSEAGSVSFGSLTPVVLGEAESAWEFAGEAGAASPPEELRITRSNLEERVDIPVPVGPTFFLDCDLPRGYAADDFRARYAPEAEGDESFGSRAAPVNVARTPWVRFRPEEAASRPPAVWTLSIESQDGLYAGSASVPHVRGVLHEPVRLELTRYSGLTGSVRDDAGALVVGVWVGLQSQALEVDRSSRTDAEGRYDFRRLEAGSYVLAVSDTDYYPWTAGEEVAAAALVQRDIELTARPPGGSLSGRITSATGAFEGRVVLFLEGLDDQDVWRRADPEWELVEWELVADFAFHELGSGSYALRCCTTDAVLVSDRARTLSPPVEAIRFHVQDDAPAATLRLRARDMRSGEALAEYDVLFHPAGSVEDVDRCTAAEPWSRDVAEGVEFVWRVHAPGYRAVQGGRGDLSKGAVLDVELEPGFSAVVNLLSTESLRSLTGVEVFADGLSVGWTNEAGHLYLDLPERPRELGFDPTRWTVHSGATFRSDLAEGGIREGWDPREVFLSAYLSPVR